MPSFDINLIIDQFTKKKKRDMIQGEIDKARREGGEVTMKYDPEIGTFIPTIKYAAKEDVKTPRERMSDLMDIASDLEAPAGGDRQVVRRTPGVATSRDVQLGETKSGFESSVAGQFQKRGFEPGFSTAGKLYPKKITGGAKDKGPTQTQRFVLHSVRKLKNQGAPIETINAAIEKNKMAPSDPMFTDELKGYKPNVRKYVILKVKQLREAAKLKKTQGKPIANAERKIRAFISANGLDPSDPIFRAPSSSAAVGAAQFINRLIPGIN